ncbi:MAG TPA: VWA domain-containing protein [Candidatus Dormibacteraeota bacterium]|nr:VWA domain-containing protein [Candidatus Dormibacteraeota bacterium]
MGKADITRGILALLVVALLTANASGVAGRQTQGPMTPPPPSQPQRGEPPQQGPPPPPGEPAQLPESSKTPQYAVSVQTQVVDVDVTVTDDNGDPIPGLKEQNFKILDDGVPQTIANFAPTKAPITIVMLMEFSNFFYGWFAYTGEEWAYNFLYQLRPQDWVALVTYAMRPRIVVDFTHNRSKVQDAIQNLGFPGFTEANMFDALLYTLNRLQNVKGKKSILLISSGLNTFSAHTLDDVLNRLKETDVTIFCVSVARPLYERADAQGAMGPSQELDFLQAENELNTFARYTGGRAWFPRFTGELPGIFQQVAASLRTQYTLAYTPSDHPNDGKYHKIKIELIAPNGKPLIIVNQYHKKLKYHIYARQGYVAPKPQTATK